jgi:transposase InsO family protein
MTDEERRQLVESLEGKRGKRRLLLGLGIPDSTYYSWRQVYVAMDQGKRKPIARRIWNRLTAEEEVLIVSQAKAHPELSPRLLAVKITDESEFYVSESKVYGLLKFNGLIAPRPLAELPAAKEWHHKTSRPNELWQIDGTNIFVANWGYYKLLPVLDDYSRKIVGWELCPDETGGSASQALERAVENAGITALPKEHRPTLLSDNGSGFISEALATYLGHHGIRHIFGKPYHPQTQGKVERFNRRIKEGVCLLVYCSPDELRAAIKDGIERYNATPHEALKNVSPNDVYAGKKEEVLRARAEKKAKTLARRKAINLKLETGQ